MERVVLDTSLVGPHLSRHSHPLHNSPLLRIIDPRRVQPIGQLIGGPCGVMPDQGCGEVLRDSRALTLRDEPLASAVENGPVQLWMSLSEVGIALHNLVHREIREQPTSLRQSSIQQLLKDTM